ncbi:unnamed protein product [Trichogramma brassicae]|uniref:Uncharacterized protein n=1 Tax=Trichogramma brassicae TaxID=86971 RepID=A0A6H5J1Z1_9HYME|nr:unnamed protein product [Trichogramma brassicae]
MCFQGRGQLETHLKFGLKTKKRSDIPTQRVTASSASSFRRKFENASSTAISTPTTGQYRKNLSATNTSPRLSKAASHCCAYHCIALDRHSTLAPKYIRLSVISSKYTTYTVRLTLKNLHAQFLTWSGCINVTKLFRNSSKSGRIRIASHKKQVIRRYIWIGPWSQEGNCAFTASSSRPMAVIAETKPRVL